MFRTFTTAAILVLSISVAQAASTTVHFGDLNLSSSRDADVLASRVDVAAKTACAAEAPETVSFFYRSIYQACIDRVGHATNAKVVAQSGQTAHFASK